MPLQAVSSCCSWKTVEAYTVVSVAATYTRELAVVFTYLTRRMGYAIQGESANVHRKTVSQHSLIFCSVEVHMHSVLSPAVLSAKGLWRASKDRNEWLRCQTRCFLSISYFHWFRERVLDVDFSRMTGQGVSTNAIKRGYIQMNTSDDVPRWQTCVLSIGRLAG